MGAFENIFGDSRRSKCPGCGKIFEYFVKSNAKHHYWKQVGLSGPKFCTPECEAANKPGQEPAIPAKRSGHRY